MSIADAGTRIDATSLYGAALSREAILSLGSMEGVYDPVVTTPAQAVELPGKILITLAMAAIGLEVNLRVLASVGRRASLVGLLATALLGIATLAIIEILL